MFRVILFTQWKWSKLPLLGGTVGAFAIPILSVQRAGVTATSHSQAMDLLRSVESWGVWYGALAAGLGLLMATSAWSSDHRGMHVYALTLPIERWRYVLLRFGAGALLLAVPIACVWLGAMLAVATIELPIGVRAFPTAVTIRFGLALFVGYAAFFAISAGTARTAGYVLVAVGGLLAAHFLLVAFGIRLDLIGAAMERLVNWPGPLEVFTGRWMLIDV